jgi:hypothetical protein
MDTTKKQTCRRRFSEDLLDGTVDHAAQGTEQAQVDDDHQGRSPQHPPQREAGRKLAAPLVWRASQYIIGLQQRMHAVNYTRMQFVQENAQGRE